MSCEERSGKSTKKRMLSRRCSPRHTWMIALCTFCAFSTSQNVLVKSFSATRLYKPPKSVLHVHGDFTVVERPQPSPHTIPPPTAGSRVRPDAVAPHIMPGQSVMPTQERESVALHWTDYCDSAHLKDEAPVLLLHGLLGSKRNFSTLATALCQRLEKRRRVIGVDLRNHGESQHAADMTYASMVQDVVDFMDQQQLERVVLVGHSMGGKVAQAMSVLHPERVEGLVAMDIAPVRYSSTEPQWKAVKDIIHTMHTVGDALKNKSQLDKLLRTSIPDPNVRAFVMTNYDGRLKQWKIPVDFILHQLDSLAGFDIPMDSTRQSYNGDVLIINGGQSRFVRHAHLNQISQFFPNHAIMTVRSAGHWVHAEAPDDTASLLKQFLDR